jgi:branched-chain amino acid transport system permease protein
MTTLAQTWQRYHLKRWGIILLIGVLLAIPLPRLLFPESNTITNSLLFSFTQLFMLVTLASDWNLTGGFTGYVDFGHAVFFGIGAYGTGIMMNRLGWSFVAGLLLGAVASALFAILIGIPTLRLKGPYFSIAMLGTFVAMREIIRVLRPITGGGQGLTLPPFLDRPLFYYITLLLAIFVVSMVWWIRRAEFGASLVAIREDEVGAEMRGINTTVHKITVFSIAAFFTGFVGGLWAYQNTFIDPDIVFFQNRTVELVMMTMLGGLGTVAGPVIGSTVIYWMRDIVWANFERWHLIVEGLLLILIVLFMPEGIMGTLGAKSGTSLQRLWRKWLPESASRKQAT